MYPDEETRTSMKMSKFTERTLPEDLNIKVRLNLLLSFAEKSTYMATRRLYNLRAWVKPAEKYLLDLVFSKPIVMDGGYMGY